MIYSAPGPGSEHRNPLDLCLLLPAVCYSRVREGSDAKRLEDDVQGGNQGEGDAQGQALPLAAEVRPVRGHHQ
jgi:hypothetical protein